MPEVTTPELVIINNNHLDRDDNLSIAKVHIDCFKDTTLIFMHFVMYTYKILGKEAYKIHWNDSNSSPYKFIIEYFAKNPILKELGFKQISDNIYVNLKDRISFALRTDTHSDYLHTKVTFLIYYNESSNTKTIELLKDNFQVDKFYDKIKKPKFYYILATINGGFDSTSAELKNNLEIDLENSYNLNCNLDKLKEKINSDAGLYLFSGDPGTGKTTLIKYLSQENTDLEFYIIPNSILHKICDPSFITFAMKNLKNAVLILEDSETLLTSRKVSKSLDLTSSLLNLTDGILSDMLNLKIICTLNTTEDIDHALLRKGRLQMHVKFNTLTETQAVNLSNKINKKLNSKNYTLAEIYNADEDNQAESLNVTKRLGFASAVS